MRFLPIVTQIFLWGAVFAGISAAGAGANGGHAAEIVGYRYGDMIAYYLLTMVSRAFSSMPGLAAGIALQIRNGEIKKFLIQPVDLIEYLFLARVAHKIVYYGVAFVPFALVFYLCRGYFPGWPPADVFLAFCASLIFSFLLGFFLEATLGMIGFWFLEVSSLLFVYMLLNFFLSGHMFPLEMMYEKLPQPWSTLVWLVPLQYLAYFPAAVFLQKVSGPALWQGLTIQALWVLLFIYACRWTFSRGVRRYSAFGG